MNSEIVQIGSLVISKAAFDVLVPLISGLLGGIFGALTTYFSLRKIEKLKYNRQKETSFKGEQRRAIDSVLQSVAPFSDFALIARASSEALKDLQVNEEQDHSQENQREEWLQLLQPYILELKALEAVKAPDKARATIPLEFHNRCIVLQIDCQRFVHALENNELAKAYSLVENLHKDSVQLNNDLRDLYKESFY